MKKLVSLLLALTLVLGTLSVSAHADEIKDLRDYALVRGDGSIDRETAVQALNLLDIDALGLDEVDRKVLDTIIMKYNGGPVGLNTIAASISEESDTIMDVVEPYLLQLGLIDRTPQGRTATRKAYEHLGIAYTEKGSEGPQAALF